MSVVKSIILLGMCCVFYSCDHKETKAKPPAPFVRVASVEQAEIPICIEAVGRLTAFNSVDIKPQVTGQLVSLHFEEGGVVKKGQLLYEINSRPYKAILDEAKARVEKDKANYSFALEQVNSYSKLIKEDYVSKLEYQQYASSERSAKASLDQSMASLEAAQVNYDFCFIHSPIDGRVGKRLEDVGNIVIADEDSESTVLLNITQVDPIFVDFSVPEKYFYRIHKLQKQSPLEIVVFPIGEEKKEFQGTLSVVNNQISTTTGMLALRGVLENTQENLWPGLFCRVQLILKIEKEGLLIPENAVSVGQKGYYVFVLNEEGIAEYRAVELGEVYQDKFHVKAGLKKGETIVTSGQLKVKPGDKVQVKKESISNEKTS
jgi:multidrug efflux system membrane fusion protein